MKLNSLLRNQSQFLTVVVFLAVLGLSVAPAQEKAAAPGVTTELGVRIPMRDGITLAANIFRPDKPGKFPVIVLRSPYGRNTPNQSNLGRFFAGNDYVYIVEDSRGRGDSEGTFHAMHDEAEDGYDTIEWAAAQPWSNGTVGTLGGSYTGENRWMAATSRPPHLKTMGVLVSPPGPFYNIPFQYGALTLLCLDWITGVSSDGKSSRKVALSEIISKLPLSTLDELAMERPIPLWKAQFLHPTYDDYWKAVDFERHWDKIDIPVLHIGGWYDDDQPGTFRNFTAMQRLGRKGQKMIVGPWPHAVTRKETTLGILDFGPESTIDIQTIMLRWYDRWLKGISNGVDTEPPVRVFIMGANTWRDETAWPLPATQWTKYYFHSAGKANTSSGDGVLSPVPPKQEPPDAYSYDPADPTPFIMPVSSGQIGGPDDYRSVGERKDVLVYSTPPLEQDVEITGPLSVKLFASSSAPDTDWNAMLLDVYPDGYALRLNDGVIRASFRESFEKPSPIKPGKIYEYAIDCWRTSMLIKKGHRIRVQIASAAFPKFDRNQNTGHPFGTDSEIHVARQTVFHDAKHPSHIVLPIIPAKVNK